MHRSIPVLVTALTRVVDYAVIDGGPGLEAYENGERVEESFEEFFHFYISFLVGGPEAPTHIYSSEQGFELLEDDFDESVRVVVGHIGHSCGRGALEEFLV